MWQLETQLFDSSYILLAYIFQASYSTLVTSLSQKSSVYQSELEKQVVLHCQIYYMLILENLEMQIIIGNCFKEFYFDSYVREFYLK